MNGRQRSVVTGIHRLKHVQHFFGADFADDNPVWPHSQAVPDQIALGHFTLAFDIFGPRFQADDMFLFELEFGGILDGDNPFVSRNKTGKNIEHRGLSSSRSAGNKDIETGGDNAFQEFSDFRRQCLEGDEIIHLQGIDGEAADGKHGAVYCKGGNDGIYTRTVCQPGIHHGTGFIDAPSHIGNDPVDNLFQVRIVLEAGIRELQLAEAFHIYVIVGVNEYIRYGRIVHERFNRTEPQDFILDFLTEPGLFFRIHGNSGLLFRKNSFDNSGNFQPQCLRIKLIDQGEIEKLDKPIMDPGFQFIHLE
ncbi:MAG: hypothetical protein A4E66_01514 [Syntrophus sp. PtaB.Bin001]|nr:MAG: hypothetical protein A4E66_01514 [Syntrophus sp. PtaB.Bin001]